jgi:uncharacterized SAM-binding protein YcdF (DUF218 family)
MIVCALYGYGKRHWRKLHQQAIARCDKAGELYREGSIEKIYIASILGKKMREHLISLGVSPDDIALDPRGLTSAGETKIFAKAIPPAAEILVVSSEYHLPRLRRLWRHYRRPIKTAAAYGGVSTFDLMKELGKLFYVLLRTLPIYIQRKRHGSNIESF